MTNVEKHSQLCRGAPRYPFYSWEKYEYVLVNADLLESRNIKQVHIPNPILLDLILGSILQKRERNDTAIHFEKKLKFRYWISRKNSLELIELSSMNKVSLV